MKYTVAQKYDRGADIAFWSPQDDNVDIHYSVPVGGNLIIDVNREHGIVGFELLHASGSLDVDRIRNNPSLVINDAPPDCPFENSDASVEDMSKVRRIGFKLRHKWYHFKTRVKKSEPRLLYTGTAASLGIGIGMQNPVVAIAGLATTAALALITDIHYK